MNIIDELKSKIKGKDFRIVFPEATEERNLRAVAQLNQEGFIKTVLVGKKGSIEEAASNLHIDLSRSEIVDPATDPNFESTVEAFVKRRKGKATKEDAEKILLDPIYYATMLVYLKRADGLVSGAIHSTADTVRPALQIIKTRPGASRVSGSFLMEKGEQRYLMADCAINIEPDAATLAEIAYQSKQTAELFNIDPKVALLSFSTKGSAKHPLVDKVSEATKLVQQLDPSGHYDGDLQFDAAFVPEVGQLKAPDSKVAGNANVFIFPSLEAGNIGYKMTQRLGGFRALGPILQGLNRPVSDLSRGCSKEDIVEIAAVTATLALMNNEN
ncbi:phosphate acetyltransferase [Xylocopilactobacillus apicola]|uniref:Phosphate acetyltransferase n=1 Tax=Xylocopilactobacillus apicola TaxID=2932184 RepID=A0AAU9DPI0_9LACO|nr:phosphate acetyltransferase [Xylocopilactobacillus apicola]BDR59067.1 phosphate acetyltransferase [Xylocopilactobacillus apicola]